MCSKYVQLTADCKKRLPTKSSEVLIFLGAEGRTRTGTPSLTADFESAASANSATSARSVALTGK